jgi:exodeoxyribonuclease-1
MGFVFYDTETTGTDAAFDQILQFAAIHTDPELRELDRFEIRCRLSPHIVPSPGAMRVTKLEAARLFDTSLHSHYEMVCQIRAKLLAWSPALFIGYNSLQFDEHLLRQAFYKSLHPPYLTNSNRNSRSDALRMVQAASLFAPNALTFPVADDGQFIFKLDQVAPLNGFAHNHAHDALADVEATIFLCRMIIEKAPELWSAFMRFSQKAAVADHISSEPIFSFSDFYFGKPYSWLVSTIGSNEKNSSEFYVYNLSIDPETLIELSDEDLVSRLNASPKPVRRLKSNACPIIMTTEDAPAIATGLQIGSVELTRRAEFLRDRDEFRARLISAFQSTKDEPTVSPHLERQLYDAFFLKGDEALMERFHGVPWEERPAIIAAFKDRRLKRIGQRLIFLERPDLLPDNERTQYDRAIAARIGKDDPESSWLTLPRALAELDELLAEADPIEAEFLQEHRIHLVDRIDRATLVLGAPAATVVVAS